VWVIRNSGNLFEFSVQKYIRKRHFTSCDKICVDQWKWLILNFRPRSSQQPSCCSFMSVNLLLSMSHHSLQYKWLVTILKR
jgi:hypothetical protein